MFKFTRFKEFNKERFNHCASVNIHKGVPILAWYSGVKECQDDQSVYLVNPTLADAALPYERVGGKTGNPIVFSHNGEAYLIYSKFESDTRGVMRWQNCSLWLSRLAIGKNHHPMVLEGIQIAGSSEHLLARCNPISMPDGSTVIPLYNEQDAHNVIFRLEPNESLPSQFDKVKPISYGFDCIQPTLFLDENELYSLSRTFSPYHKLSNIQIYSPLHNICDRNGLKKAAIDSPLYNLNSSIHAINWGKDIFILWNRKRSRSRTNLSLGRISVVPVSPSNVQANVEVKDYVDITKTFKGSYPSLAVHKNKLHFAYTNNSYNIAYHVWNKRQYKQESRINRRTINRFRRDS
ncbi:exo-alpha-sialidase [bacterium]|nr:exo-alpha-sialidase [bacterium]